MSKKFYIEGHKPKTSYEDEDTLIIKSKKGFGTLDEASEKAREYFEKEKNLGLAVIYKIDTEGTKDGIKLIFKDNEGQLEESLLFY